MSCGFVSIFLFTYLFASLQFPLFVSGRHTTHFPRVYHHDMRSRGIQRKSLFFAFVCFSWIFLGATGQGEDPALVFSSPYKVDAVNALSKRWENNLQSRSSAGQIKPRLFPLHLALFWSRNGGLGGLFSARLCPLAFHLLAGW